MRIVLLGAPGSGKGTQAAMLVQELNVPHISSGELLRAAVKAGTPLGQRARTVMDRGELISDEIMLGLIEERLSEPDANIGFVLDGYPRNLAQAEQLDELLERTGLPLDEALQIDADEELAIRRIRQRALKEGRSDDTDEVVRNRMRVYAEQTAPIYEYYARKGLLSRVLGDGSVDEVFQRIRGVLQIRSA